MDPWMEKYIERMDSRLDSIEEKVDQLLKFKWQIIGGSVVVSVLISIAFKFIEILNKQP